MNAQSRKLLLVSFSILLIASAMLILPLDRRLSSDAPPKLEAGIADPAARAHNGKIQRELESLRNSQEYKDVMERMNSGNETPADFEFMFRIGELKGKLIKEPRLEKYTKYPPDDPKGLEMWEWWRAMTAADPSFEYKRPISFFGKVVDDTGKPIPDVDVFASIKGPDGDSGLARKTDAQGHFKFEGRRGKFVTIDMGKLGYGRGPNSFGTFEYAEFFSERFHQPDPSDPVVFVLPRLVP